MTPIAQQVSLRNIALKIKGRHYKHILQCDMAPTMFLKDSLQNDTSYKTTDNVMSHSYFEISRYLCMSFGVRCPTNQISIEKKAEEKPF